MVTNAASSASIRSASVELAEITPAKTPATKQTDTSSIQGTSKSLAEHMLAETAALDGRSASKTAQRQQQINTSYLGSFSSNALVMGKISQFLSPKDQIAFFDAMGQNTTTHIHYTKKLDLLREGAPDRAVKEPEKVLKELSISQIERFAGSREEILSTLKKELIYAPKLPSLKEINDIFQKLDMSPKEIEQLRPFLELGSVKNTILDLHKQGKKEQKTSMTFITESLSRLIQQEKKIKTPRTTEQIFPENDRKILSNTDRTNLLGNLQTHIVELDSLNSDPKSYTLNQAEIKPHFESIKLWLAEQIGEKVPTDLEEKKEIATRNRDQVVSNLNSMLNAERDIKQQKTGIRVTLGLNKSSKQEQDRQARLSEVRSGIKELTVKLYSVESELGSIKNEIYTYKQQIEKKSKDSWKPESLKNQMNSLTKISEWINENSGVSFPIRDIQIINDFIDPVMQSMKNLEAQMPSYQRNMARQEAKDDFQFAKTVLLENLYVQIDNLNGSTKMAADNLIKEHQSSLKSPKLGSIDIQRIGNEKSGRKQANILRNHLFFHLGKENHDAAKLGIQLLHAMPDMNVNSSYNHRNAQGLAYTAIKCMLNGRLIKGSHSEIQTRLNAKETTDMLCALAEVLPRLSNAPRPQEMRERARSTKDTIRFHGAHAALWTIIGALVAAGTHGIGAAVAAGIFIAGAIPTRPGVRDSFFKRMMDDIGFPHEFRSSPETCFKIVKESLPVWDAIFNNLDKYTPSQHKEVIEKYAHLMTPKLYDVSAREELVKLTVDMNQTLVSKILTQKDHPKDFEFKTIMQLLDRQETLCPVIREREQKAQSPIWTQVLDNLARFSPEQQKEISKHFAANTSVNQWA